MNLEIIYKDEFIVCVSKPNNVVVHHAYHSRNIIEEQSLLEKIYDEFGEKMFPIHRLDRKTSGIILLARNNKIVSSFQQLFLENKIKKTYLGIVRGHSPEKLVIDSPVKGRDSKVYKDAETLLETIDKTIQKIPVKPYETSRYSLVKLTPRTGRLHQLRIHTNKISHPLIGDPKYGDKNHNLMYQKKFDCYNLFLHAYSLKFVHPLTKKELKLVAKLPDEWNIIFKRYGWNL